MAKPTYFPSPSELPQGNDVTLKDSSFFRPPNDHRKLPSPKEVQDEAKKQHREIDLDPRLTRAIPVVFKSLGLFVKYGPRVSIAEGQCLWALRRSFGNQVPVPEVFGWRVHENRTFLYMQLIDGRTLKEAWPGLGTDEKESLITELKAMIRIYRSAQQKPGTHFVGNTNGHAVDDDVFIMTETVNPCPFPSIQMFHDWFTTITARKRHPGKCPKPDLDRHHMSDQGPITLTHSDLNGLNIMVTRGKSPRVMAIIDWQYAGWLPPYWESSKASSRSCGTGQDWIDVYVPKLLEGLPQSVYWEYYVGCLGI